MAITSKGFRAWEGDNYRKPKLLRYRTLIVGESLYAKNTRPRADHLSMCVRKVLEGNELESGRLWKGIAGMLAGERQRTPEQLGKWCHDVAFHNYVQVALDNSRKRPSTKQFRLPKNKGALKNVIETLEPKLIIVLGFGTWRHIEGETSDGPRLPNRKFASKYFDNRKTYWFHYGKSSRALAIVIKHPSRAFRYQDWHVRFEDGISAIQKANG